MAAGISGLVRKRAAPRRSRRLPTVRRRLRMREHRTDGGDSEILRDSRSRHSVRQCRIHGPRRRRRHRRARRRRIAEVGSDSARRADRLPGRNRSRLNPSRRRGRIIKEVRGSDRRAIARRRRGPTVHRRRVEVEAVVAVVRRVVAEAAVDRPEAVAEATPEVAAKSSFETASVSSHRPGPVQRGPGRFFRIRLRNPLSFNFP